MHKRTRPPMEKGSSFHIAGIEAHKQNNVSNPEVAKNGSSSRHSRHPRIPALDSLRQSDLQRPCRGLTLSVSTLG
jgi:hypothetical protein